ncbi:MAG TPA: glycosyltransferase family 2 protein [Anaerohalosphaeraceae bacterium]|nr:glycosyltransferase family 2 protein [Anaerohalosphaeraceae bacterium]HOL88660.1 glycosyltransferase family 2 protein [Anaerohalosphaeraceae bacterium]HPP57059.1 glycosyltransferase family 2 protein [Anaerohalosphaeraceae bacterium]
MSAQPAPSSAASSFRSISVFFPCFNERENLEPLVRQALDVLGKMGLDYEIIIVDDGSTDGTGALADALAAENPRIKVIHHPVNKGYGAALQSGFRAASKELIFYTDGDRQFDLNELPPLLPLIEQYDIVSCYRINRQDGWIRRFNGFAWTRLVCLLFHLKLKDIDCSFKLYKRKIFDGMPLVSTGALIDTEVLARAVRKGYTITQVGVHHYPRRAGKATGAKLRVIARAFYELFKLRNTIVKQKT